MGRLGHWWKRRVGQTQAPARLRSTEAGAPQLLDVLPAHLIPGGGPLSSMSMWWVESPTETEWVVEGGGRAGVEGGGLVWGGRLPGLWLMVFRSEAPV